MVIIYSYLKHGPNIVACIPFRYNIDEENKIESREIVLDVDGSETYQSIRQQLLGILDKEKMESGKDIDFSGDLSGVVTIE